MRECNPNPNPNPNRNRNRNRDLDPQVAAAACNGRTPPVTRTARSKTRAERTAEPAFRLRSERHRTKRAHDEGPCCVRKSGKIQNEIGPWLKETAWTSRLKSGRSFRVPRPGPSGRRKSRVEREAFFKFSIIQHHLVTRQMAIGKCITHFPYCSCAEYFDRSGDVVLVRGKRSLNRSLSSHVGRGSSDPAPGQTGRSPDAPPINILDGRGLHTPERRDDFPQCAAASIPLAATPPSSAISHRTTSVPELTSRDGDYLNPVPL